MAVTSAIGVALGGGKPITFESVYGIGGIKSSAAYGESTVMVDGKPLKVRKVLENFPNDVSYMTPESVSTLLLMSKTLTKHPWDKERAAAHLGDEPVAKRCSASEILWAQYRTYKSIGKDIPLELVKIWAEMEWIGKVLEPQTWDIAQANKENLTPTQYRTKKLGRKMISDLTERYKQLMHESTRL